LPSQFPLLLSRATVRKNVRETPDTFTLLLELQDGRGPKDFRPGQFNMLHVLGIGESPISVASFAEEETLMHTVRSVGAVTSIVTRLKEGQSLALRGPFGSQWPVDKAVGKQLLVIAGGLGLPPLRPVILGAIARSSLFKGIKVIYGARTPSDLIYTYDYDRWKQSKGCEFFVTVDRGDATWKGNVGVVTTLFARAGIDPRGALAFVCGPELMIRFSILELLKLGLTPESIYISLERNMNCGVGTCGHCQLGPYFICRDGPVFHYPKAKGFFPKEGI